MPNKTIIYNKQRIQFDDKDVLGVGGEASVILHGNRALKIYHDPSTKRANKLKDFMSLNISLPDNVAAPLELVYDTKSNIVGFSMYVAKKCKEAISLSNKKYRAQEQITPNEVIDFFIHMKETLDAIHKHKIIVGDYNDLNVLFNDKLLSVFIDADSFQFGSHPCSVGTEQFLDPSLYGIDLSKKQYFSKETDWYSFAVMLFKCLLLAHPFGGVYDSCPSLTDRAKKKITIFDSGVIYPRIAIKPETLSVELLDYFNDIFKKGQRINMPDGLLFSCKHSFIKCDQCSNYYYKGRGKCPICFVLSVQQQAPMTSQVFVTQTIHDDTCLVDDFYSTEGTIVFSKVIDDQIIFVEVTTKQTNLIIIKDSETGLKKDKFVFKLWESRVRGVKFDFFKTFFIVALHNELMIFEVKDNNLTSVKQTKTLKYDDQLMFGCSDTSLYRLTEQVMLSSDIMNGHIIDTVVTQTLENQTWFKVGRSGLGFGLFRVFNEFKYFVFSSKGRYDVLLLNLKGKVIDKVVEISKNTLLFLVKTLNKGKTYSHYYLIDEKGNVLREKTVESINSEILKNLYGKILLGSTIIYPTDAGIVIEKEKQLVLKKETEKYVDSDSTLYLYKDGILSICEHKVTFLKLIKKQ